MVSGPGEIGKPREVIEEESNLLEAMVEKFLGAYKKQGGSGLDIRIPLGRDVKRDALARLVMKYQSVGWPSVETETKWGETYLILSRVQGCIIEGAKNPLIETDPYA